MKKPLLSVTDHILLMLRQGPKTGITFEEMMHKSRLRATDLAGPLNKLRREGVVGLGTTGNALVANLPTPEEKPAVKQDDLRKKLTEAYELISELVGEGPMSQDEQGGCVWCGGPGTGSRYAGFDAADHCGGACPWYEGGEWLKVNEGFAPPKEDK